ncbi:hypothetical protein EVAR_75784_1 [Eumeta japonica]|uniref:Uncharacterized protein n=1 Tax=Eumeta variegata TaxID=151549 RepID=A0A4C1TFJ6_EUMVA|nr:hypothetical protein EVAR_75784_1 [Eumeta japonica]
MLVVLLERTHNTDCGSTVSSGLDNALVSNSDVVAAGAAQWGIDGSELEEEVCEDKTEAGQECETGMSRRAREKRHV